MESVNKELDVCKKELEDAVSSHHELQVCLRMAL